MTMSVLRRARDAGEASYQTRLFRRVVEDHLDLIKTRAISKTEIPTPQQFGKYRGDFYGLLIELGVKEQFHWITLRVNGLHSPADYVDENLLISIINPSYIKTIVDKHLSTLARI